MTNTFAGQANRPGAHAFWPVCGVYRQIFTMFLIFVWWTGSTSGATAAFSPLAVNKIFLQQGEKVLNTVNGGFRVSGRAITPDGKLVFAGMKNGLFIGSPPIDDEGQFFIVDLVSTGEMGEVDTIISTSDDGSTVVIGTRNNTHDFIHILSGDSWTSNQTFEFPRASYASWMLPSISINADGTILAYGTSYVEEVLMVPSAIFVMELIDANWIVKDLPLDDLEITVDTEEERRSQVAISADGSVVLAGFPWADDGAGKAFVYLRDEEHGTYFRAAMLFPSDESATSVGDPLAINRDGNVAILFTQSGDNYRGGFWVFQQNNAVPTVWTQVKEMYTIQDPTLGPQLGSGIFGQLAATMGPDETIVVGRKSYKSGQGAVWIFRRKEEATNPEWERLEQRLEPVGGGEIDPIGFGNNLAISGEGTLVVGARDYHLGGSLWIYRATQITSTPSMSPNPSPLDGNASANQALIITASVAGSIGGLFLLVALGVVLFFLRKRRRYRAVAIQTPATTAFLTHEWGDDAGHNNHQRVTKINEELKKLHVVTWFDTDRLTGDIINQIVAAIDKTNFVVVFLTKRYMEKAAQDSSSRVDYSQMEFQYAMRRQGRDRIIVVVMEHELLDCRKWFGPIGALLGDTLYIDSTKNETAAQVASEIQREIVKRQEAMGDRHHSVMGKGKQAVVANAADNPQFDQTNDKA